MTERTRMQNILCALSTFDRLNVKTLLLVSLSASILFCGNSFGQSDTTKLTLFESIRIAQAQGPQAAITRSAFENKRSLYRSFVAGYYPQIVLMGDLPGYYHSINTIVLPDGSTIFSPQSQATSSLSMGITQKIYPTGGQLSIYSGLNRIDLLETGTKYYRSNPLSINYQQPLFQINTQKWDWRSQQLQYESASRQLAEGLEDCAIDVTDKFFALYLSVMTLHEAGMNLANNDTLYQISTGRFNVGKIGENDLLQSELALLNARNQFENAKTAVGSAEREFTIALGLPLGENISLIPPESIPSYRIDTESALADADQNRSDVTGFELQRLSAERNVEQAKSNMFSMTMNASFGYNQRAPLILDSYHNLLDQRQLSVSFDIPLFRWGAGSEAIDAALADQRRIEFSVDQQKKEFRNEVSYQVSRINILQKQVAVAAKADTVAQRRFTVAKERYLIGKIDIPNLFLAQSEKDNAQRGHIQILADFWMTHFRVRRLTLYDFETNTPLLLSTASE